MRPIPVPRPVSMFRLGDDEPGESGGDILVPAIPPSSDNGFPFWKYVLLSVTAGLITHSLIRTWDAKKRRLAPPVTQPVFLPPIVAPSVPASFQLRRSKKKKKSARRNRR